MRSSAFVPLLLGLTVLACKVDKKEDSESDRKVVNVEPETEHNTLTEAEKAEGWALLFDGKSLDGWHLYNDPDNKPIWEVQEGVLVCDPLNGTGKHGDLVTDKTFKNYELVFDWDLPDTGNSGVFINVQEGPDFRATYSTGPEYQLLGEKHLDYGVVNKRSGCLYSFAPQGTDTKTQPSGAWNHSRIVQHDGKVEFYLNGNLTAQADFTSALWKDWVATSGFKDAPEFAKRTEGHIGLQLWTSAVRFRNIKIREF